MKKNMKMIVAHADVSYGQSFLKQLFLGYMLIICLYWNLILPCCIPIIVSRVLNEFVLVLVSAPYMSLSQILCTYSLHLIPVLFIPPRLSLVDDKLLVEGRFLIFLK